MKRVFIIALIILTGCNDMKNDRQFQKGYADVNGLRMYYEIYGDGKPIVLIHGAGSTIYTTFGRIIDELARTRKVIGVELQAHGHTSDRNAELSFTQDADDVAELIKQLHIDNYDVFGFSNGGSTALQLAIRHPERVRKVIAASVLLKKDGAFPGFWDFMKNAKLDNMPVQYRQAFMEITGDSAHLQTMHDKCVNRMLSFVDMSDDELRSIKAPVLLVTGDADVCTSEHIVAMSRLIPGSKLAIFPGGHGEYMGELTTLKSNHKQFEIIPVLNNFLE